MKQILNIVHLFLLVFLQLNTYAQVDSVNLHRKIDSIKQSPIKRLGNDTDYLNFLIKAFVAPDYLEQSDSLTKQIAINQLQFEFSKEIAKKDLQIKNLELAEVKAKSRYYLVVFFFASILMCILVYAYYLKNKSNTLLKKEKKRSDELLLNILPYEVAEELKENGSTKTKSFDLVTVLFTDFKNFTHVSEVTSPEILISELNSCFTEFDKIINKNNIEKIKTIGDSYMCAGGLPSSNTTHAEDVVKAALEIRDYIDKFNLERHKKSQLPFEIRIGVNTGPVVAGIVGVKKFAYDIWGDTVNIASRMESSGEVGKVNISGSTYEKVKEHFNCIHRGKIQAKNKGEIDMYFVEEEFRN